MEGKREEESRRRGKCHRRAARLGRAAEVAARRPADDNFRVRADQRIRRVTVLESIDEAGAAVAAHARAVVDVLAFGRAVVVAVADQNTCPACCFAWQIRVPDAETES